MGGTLSCNSSSSSSSSSSLTEDLLIEILLCLPIKTLLRFKSVCKSWLALIESSEFIHRHTITLVPENLLGTFIFQYNTHKVYWNIFSVTSDHESDVFEELAMQPYYRNPKYHCMVDIVGSCNGLICLQDYEVRDVSLWNPAINQFRILPKPITFAGIDNGKVNRDFVAFGFDVETKDYKVVLVTYFDPQTDYPICFYDISIYQYPYRVQVYSLSTDSWRPLEDLVMPTYPKGRWEGRYHGGYLNGSYYCLGEEWISGFPSYSSRTPSNLKTVWSVLSFDFTKEIFRTMQLPDEITHTMDIITVLDEKIAIIDEVRNTNYCTYHIWVLNELGVKESWTKLYTIGQRPIGLSSNGEFIFLTGFSADKNKLLLLNPSTQESHVVKGLQYVDIGILRTIAYRRSLVPVGRTRNPK